ncbi:MAG: hypothetical protein H0T89_10445 [Deltaproteobacteria bacterium]|nr:hypothetical protein [Deltaproteobacteria bacterium]
MIAGIASREREGLSGASREALDKILDETLRASRMLENRAAIAKVDAGSALPREWLSVEELVGAVLARLEPRLVGRSVETSVDGDVLIHSDAVMAELLLINLLDNATRYTPPGSAIEITARRVDSATTLEVSDHGPGLSAEAVRNVDQPAESRRGLTACQRIVASYKGKLEMVPRAGGGAVVRITIPDASTSPTSRNDK